MVSKKIRASIFDFSRLYTPFFSSPPPPQTTESQLYFLTATKVKWKILPPSPAGYLPGGEGPRKVLGGAVTETTH